MNICHYIFKAFDVFISSLENKMSRIRCYTLLLGNGVHYSSFSTRGVPYIMVANSAKGLFIGKNFSMNNGLKNNPIGCPQRCTLWVGNEASITIGDHVGISQTALISHCNITVGNNVKIGGGLVCIRQIFIHWILLFVLVLKTKNTASVRLF